MSARAPNLPNYSMFAAMLAMAGLPIYIFAPKFYVDEFGVSLTLLGSTLFLLRLLDFVQDPILGWVADQLGSATKVAVMVSIGLLMMSMTLLFAQTPLISPIMWFGVIMAILFTVYSFLTIVFYALGSVKAETLGQSGHIHLAVWREAGALIGVCVACVTPFVFMGFENLRPFTGLTIIFIGVCLIAGWTMRNEWRKSVRVASERRLPILHQPLSRKLLLITVLNAAPVAVTSTLFLFFVESRLGSETAAGPLLLLFFLSAAISVPVWATISEKLNAKQTLLIGMMLSILTFAFAFKLGTGQIMAFAFVCAASGMALGADMLLLPALFSRHVAAKTENSGQAFGLWSFCSKLTLALAAVTVLPLLEMAGFQSGQQNSPAALQRLSQLYALVPCVLKLIAFALLYFTVLEEI